MIFRKNQLIIITSGEYSDYSIDFVCRSLKEFDEQDIKNVYLQTLSDEEKIYNKRNYAKFIPWLIRNGFVEAQTNIIEWCIGGYGNFESEESAYILNYEEILK